MRVRLLVATASMAAFGLLFAACQAVTGLTDLEKVECVDCEAGIPAAETGPPCAHTFCGSFDEGMLMTGWKSQATSPGATLMLDTQMSKSPPASFLAGVPKGDTGSMVAALGQSFAMPLKGAHLELDFRVSQVGTFPAIIDAGVDTGGGAGADASAEGGTDGGGDSGMAAPPTVLTDIVRLASISSSEVATASGVSLAWRNGGAFVLVFTPNAAGVSELALPLVPAPAVDTWLHLKLDVVFSATGGGSVKVAIDGATVLDNSGLSIVGSGSGGAQLELGVVTRDVTPELKSNYDNVTLDLDK
jgi:hypothetical protein